MFFKILFNVYFHCHVLLSLCNFMQQGELIAHCFVCSYCFMNIAVLKAYILLLMAYGPTLCLCFVLWQSLSLYPRLAWNPLYLYPRWTYNSWSSPSWASQVLRLEERTTKLWSKPILPYHLNSTSLWFYNSLSSKIL